MSAERAPVVPRTPAGRLAALVILAAREFPTLDPPDLDTEPCDGLGGPWEAAIWSAAGRRVVVVCFGPGTTKIVRSCEGWRSIELYRRACDDRVRLALAWLEGGGPWP